MSGCVWMVLQVIVLSAVGWGELVGWNDGETKLVYVHGHVRRFAFATSLGT